MINLKKNCIINTTRNLVLFFVFLISIQNVFCQEDTIVPKIRKNTVRINITNPAIFGNSYILGYERLVSKNQSFSINAGTFSLPKLKSIDFDSEYDIVQTDNSAGFNISGDYRFYQRKVNRYDAPRGVYIGPYAAYNHAERSMTMTSSDVDGQFDAGYKLSIATLGVQLGYQFVFWNRLSLDMILMGPGISGYSIKTELSTTLDPEKEAELFQKINDAIADKIPGFDKVIQPGEMHRNDTFNTTSAGFRYMVMLGFRF
jgi:hypothetical protein